MYLMYLSIIASADWVLELCLSIEGSSEMHKNAYSTYVINVDNGCSDCIIELNVCRPCGTLSAPCSSFSGLSRFRSPAIGTAEMNRSCYSHKMAERCSRAPMRKLTSRHGFSLQSSEANEQTCFECFCSIHEPQPKFQ